MNKDEFIEEFINKMYVKLDEMPKAFKSVNSSDKKHMENGFIYATTSASQLLSTLLDGMNIKGKTRNAFREFVDKKLGLIPPTEEDIEREKQKVEMEKQKLEIAKLRAEQAKLKGKSGSSSSSSVGDFVKRANAYDPFKRQQ